MEKKELNYTEFVRLIAKESGVTKADIRKTINAMAELLPQVLVEHGSMNIRNIGTFELRKKPMPESLKKSLVDNSVVEGLKVESFPEEILTVFFKKSKFAKDSLTYYNQNRSEIDLTLPTLPSRKNENEVEQI